MVCVCFIFRRRLMWKEPYLFIQGKSVFRKTIFEIIF